VYPAEVEAVIMEMEGVTGVCVFGVPDEQWGEAIRAVVEAEGKEAAEIIDHVGSRIARYKRPKTVEFTGEIPRTAAGEVDRDAVKAKWG
jgi:acyl-CoA synthetase (AMP-forming)/AMP-acid ligase II